MATDIVKSPLPLVVQLSFAGSRMLFDAAIHQVPDQAAFEESVCAQLTTILARLPDELGLSQQHFFCGISQLAIGGDTVFTRACERLGIVQRVFLPQPIDEYLSSGGGQQSDFTVAQQQIARDLLASPRIIQQCVVSGSPLRNVRFSDTNLELLRVSDVIVALVRPFQPKVPGGTVELIGMAENRGRPVLVATIEVAEERPVLSTEWRNLNRFKKPIPPTPIRDLGTSLVGKMPPPQASQGTPTTAAIYGNHLKSVAGDLAKAHKGLFKTAALVIIGTHVVATAIALCALQFRATFAHSLGWFLIPELVLIGLGFCIHIRLHRREASHRWATSRLLAELGRSVSALGGQHLHLDYLFQLPFPGTFSPLLRTLNVLHLASTVTDSVPWQLHRSRYLAGRLDGADKQIDFYSRQSAHASGWLKIAHRTFNACSGSAFIAAFCKLLHLGGAHGAEVTGPLAILLPVLAVAALSLAAAFDLEARKYTFADMVEFLLAQRKLINAATTEREFCQLLLETESRLLGEIVNWYSRRAFTGVA